MKKRNTQDLTFTEMMEISLNEVLDDLTGKKKLKSYVKIKIPEVYIFSASEIKELRESIGCTQNMFAQILGVSKKTIYHWEHGKVKPNGSSCRLMSFMKNRKKDFINHDLELMGCL
jgi:putative transcriptional regulator